MKIFYIFLGISFYKFVGKGAFAYECIWFLLFHRSLLFSTTFLFFILTHTILQGYLPIFRLLISTLFFLLTHRLIYSPFFIYYNNCNIYFKQIHFNKYLHNNFFSDVKFFQFLTFYALNRCHETKKKKSKIFQFPQIPQKPKYETALIVMRKKLNNCYCTDKSSSLIGSINIVSSISKLFDRKLQIVIGKL